MLSLAHFPWGVRSLEARTNLSSSPDMWCSQSLPICFDPSQLDLHTLLVGGLACYLAITYIYRVASRMSEAMQELEEEQDMAKNIKEGIEARRKRIDDESGFGDSDKKTIKAEKKTLPKKESYEDDFGKEAEISDLKKKKEELLKGISGKKESEKKEIRKKLKEINDKIMDLENS